MPVEANIFSSRLQIRYNVGVDEKGNNIIRSKTYSNLKADVTDEAIYEVATAISDLQTNTLEEVHKIQDVMIIQV
ncbi:DUF1659 domain-containing protein [Alkalibaculum sp. M08DMB]|uniref:DUF1659 domain-containing protein n=1 Tax=Alkalibaculum sporogenes TaxID=2655001 RepID=A0A6A7KD92_9FIRM|nr:DUF1659 domain-containing protein [Alkalibaculum sporogenes]MPW26983.1 DUF1659 domain-containing protein [Alkalibaculum sporogenes]